MVLGIGTDILKIERIRNAFQGENDAFMHRVFTDNEREQARNRHDPVLYFATRFAGKEAVFKCFGIEGNGTNLSEIEILGAETEQPQVNLLGRFQEIAKKKGIRNIQISLSYETDYAIAFAMAQD